MKKEGIQTRNRKLSGKTKKKRSSDVVGSSSGQSFMLPDVLAKNSHNLSVSAGYNDVKPYLSLGSPYTNASYGHHSNGEMKPYLSLTMGGHHHPSSLTNAFNIVGALA